eukprot:TRINITY_DN5247_c0_g4_i1.p1 TRINITY_DN5247_c0_g4~~TRINITY_DN5247_c0_g4_i1.p1  ORF type:complete len:310 (-),score=32.50 TRINITY_DN5247_c0_g4_i1:1180-2109(-)
MMKEEEYHYKADISHYILPRPWLALYGLRLRRGCANPDESSIKKNLPPEVLRHVLQRLPPYSLAVLQCVSKYLKQAASQQELWQQACQEAFGEPMNTQQSLKKLKVYYGGVWKRMYVERPHIRFEGVYVARNTYLRRGQIEFHVRNPVHLVVYFRYLRFFSDGRVLYRTSPYPPDKIAKTMVWTPKTKNNHNTLMKGRYKLWGSKLRVAALYSHSDRSELRMKLRLRSTVPGANNRIDIEEIVTYDGLDGSRADLLSVAYEEEEEEGEVDGEGKVHRRGMSPCVFIPWESVTTHVLNLPKDQMDFFIPG